MPRMYLARNLTLFLLLVLFCAQLTLLVFVTTGYHDFATFITAHKLIGEGLNPYQDNFFRNGYVLIFPLWVYSKILGSVFGPSLWNLLNLLGLVVPLTSLTPKKSWGVRFLILVTLLFTSPARSMFANVQHTGIVIGLLSYIFMASGKTNRSLKSDFVAAAMLLVAFELKPQTVIPLMFLLLFSRKQYRCVGIWVAMSLVIHLGLSIFYKLPLDFLWLKSLAGVSQNSVAIDAGDNSIWGVFSHLFGFATIWSIIAYLTYFMGALLLSNSKKLGLGQSNEFALVFLAPLFLSYVHPYDFIIVALFVICALFQHDWPRPISACLILLLVPTVANIRAFIFFTLSAFAIFLIFVLGRKILQDGELVRISLGFSTLAILGYTFSYFAVGLEQIRISLLYSLILLLYIGLLLSKKSIKVITSSTT